MTMIFLAGEGRPGKRSVEIHNTIQGAGTGRWCRADAGLYPDH